jgi:threonine synthase
VGDPTVLRLRAAIAAGSIPFTCQGPESGLAIEGGQTLGYEMVSSLRAADGRLDAVVVQAGGGALASAVAAAFAEARALGVIDREPRLFAALAAGCAPLERAWTRLRGRAATDGMHGALDHAARHRSAYMRPWEPEPASIAHGILDDETYDWLAVVEAMARTGGRAVVVDEATIAEANDLALASTGIDADHTGTAGLAGLLDLLRHGDVRTDEAVAVMFTGVRRDGERGDAPGVEPEATTRPRERSTR